MSEREIDVDALFERDADTRLLERRRREELGLAPQSPPVSTTPIRFGAESIVGDNTLSVPPRAAGLRVTLEARPAVELIPGAVATIVVALHDDGDADAQDARLRIAIPPEAEPIPGSFAREDIAIDGEALLGEGLQVGTVPAGGALRMRFAIRVLPGTEPLDVVAYASAPGVPAIAAPALRLPRRAGHAAYTAPRPFYELEPDEIDEETRGEPSSPSIVDTVLNAPAAPPVAVPEPEPVAPECRESPAQFVLSRAIDAAALRALDRLFSGSVPHGLAALGLLTAVAAVDGPLGVALGLRAFTDAVAAALPRALVAVRIGRPAPPVVSEASLHAIRADADVPAVAEPHDGPRLVTRFDAAQLDTLRAVLRRRLDEPSLRGIQLLLAVVPRALEGAGSANAARAGDALAGYRVAAGAWLMRVTVRRAVDRGYDPFTADDAALHAAARALVETLHEAVP